MDSEESWEDLGEVEVAKYLSIATRYQSIYFASKPIVARPSLLETPAAKGLLGSRLIADLYRWLERNPPADMFVDRSRFMIEGVFPFDQEFGDRIVSRVEAQF